jgi:hypothetical protein
MMAAEEVAGVRGQRAQRKCVINGNIRAKLSNYIEQVFECKADSPHYSRRLIATRIETRQGNRNERLMAGDNHHFVPLLTRRSRPVMNYTDDGTVARSSHAACESCIP